MTRSLAHTIVSTSVGMFIAMPAFAASSVKVSQTEWAGGVTLPSYVNMYIYLPGALATKPPILVASHHCGGSASSSYDETKSSFVSLADKNGFIIIFPEATGQNCWDVGSSESLKHDGGGDTHAIAQMVRYTLSKYKADPGRVYAFGGSSGAMMTQALLGIYPDIFMGGVAVSGVPCGCWAQGYNDVTGSGSTAQWSGPCANGEVSKTAQEWGDLVRKMFPSYTGHRPRVQLWHGDPDPTIDEKNLPEAIKEWTNLLGLASSPTTTDSPNSNTTHQIWKTSCGTQLETFSIKGAGHGVQWDTPTTSGFLGLDDKAATQDPETALCPDAVPSGSGTGGAGGQSGSGGGSGTPDSGAGGNVRDGGVGGKSGSGGAAGMTGGGSGGNAGGSGEAGTRGSGGRFGTGGIESSGGNSTSGKGGASGSGGVVGSGGSSTSGSGGSGVGGAPSVGGANGSGGGSGSGATSGDSTAGGCNCSVGMTPGFSQQWKVGLLLLGLTLIHRRRRRAARP